ncbi:MAG: hypothetical protein ACTSQX_16025, partial [Candidatus Heimdallarchaeota archaeon]
MFKRKIIQKILVLILTISMSTNAISIMINNVSAMETYNEGFESTFPPDGWTFDHQSFWSKSYYHSKEGNYALCATPSTSSGQLYDGGQHFKTFEDGSIEGWAYAMQSNYLYLSFWLRTGVMVTTDGKYSFDTGYWLRITQQTANLYRRENGVNTKVGTYSLGEWCGNKWWHMKLEAIDGFVKAWITKSSTFSFVSQITYTDSNPLPIGKAGLIARTTMLGTQYSTFYDAIEIKSFDDGIFPRLYGIYGTVTSYEYGHHLGDRVEVTLSNDIDSISTFTSNGAYQLSLTYDSSDSKEFTLTAKYYATPTEMYHTYTKSVTIDPNLNPKEQNIILNRDDGDDLDYQLGYFKNP